MQNVLNNYQVINRKRKFNLFLGLKRISVISFNAVCEYFGIEGTTDKILFFGFYAFCTVILLMVLVIRIQLATM